ncbi:MAG: asparagine synthase (glutamine-hydrolyzing) [Nitrospira sp.]|nr:asparagine synthase (glutamine-hydrolyzing) [Nitrospira sp.]MDH4242226.1 asparagine synthase (glutamine-hydrolyzing) [Nitrospira sp.]MDH4356286.1 asparagine synthase (glutamine-hydrolyzing) [Nitrospira sp.]MDH5317622.1 asparagine synthase (glutamine-hydrolyzing) [Nitrospira sp.]
MCGILGRFYRQPAHRSPFSKKDLATLAHRGPDGSGVYTDPHIQFGHTRLAIIDLTEGGHQPMTFDSGRYVVTYNGEIYNYLELRTELEAKGERFVSRSDTEVLLAAYKVWGRECVSHFSGMFAFALWDEREKSLFLARDRCGEKPLFYYRDGQCLSFASELKGLLPLLTSHPALDLSVVDMYLHYQYVPEPFTLLQGVQKLPAAHTLMLSLDNWFAEPVRYWSVEEPGKITGLPTDIPGILSCIREGLEEAVKLTLRSDVPVGVALSGGIDSGAIATLAQKHSSEIIHAFSVGYPGRPHYDEREQARSLAKHLGMIFHEVELPVDSFVEFFPRLVQIMDEPIADPAAFGHYSVPKAARDMGIKVLLAGIGGDELFWGYPWVTKTVGINQTLASLPWSIQQLHFYGAEPNFNDAFRIKRAVYGTAMRSVSAENPFRPTDVGSRKVEQMPAAVIRMLFDTWLVSNCLSIGDRVSMGVGVETRLPFLDVELIEIVMAMRSKHPDHTFGQKAWLRAALKGILPEEVCARPKAGFQPPVREWLFGVTTRYGNSLCNGNLIDAGVLNDKKLDSILQDMPKQGWPGLFFLYKLVLLEMWLCEVVGT